MDCHLGSWQPASGPGQRRKSGDVADELGKLERVARAWLASFGHSGASSSLLLVTRSSDPSEGAALKQALAQSIQALRPDMAPGVGGGDARDLGDFEAGLRRRVHRCSYPQPAHCLGSDYGRYTGATIQARLRRSHPRPRTPSWRLPSVATFTSNTAIVVFRRGRRYDIAVGTYSTDPLPANAG